jgi:hypothetical protein
METDAALYEQMRQFYDDPAGFVAYAFNWGRDALADSDGPEAWQLELLERMAAQLKADPDANIREAIASGHGIGKTTTVAWLILWAMSTRAHLTGVVTANTMSQLSTKTWRELALWHERAINRHWFKWSATKFWHKDHPATWAVQAEPWSEHRSEAFAGRHGKYKLIVFDEASAIPDKIFEVTEGAMTDPRSIWCIFGNPTKNSGRFYRAFTDPDSRWGTQTVDSRSVRFTDKGELEAQIKANGGIDSDFTRVRVLGLFPRRGSLEFISAAVVEMAMKRSLQLEAWMLLPVVLGVDVARFGDDQSVICVRQGRKVHELRRFRGLNTIEVAQQTIRAAKDWTAVAVFVDGVGVGAGVVDYLMALGHGVVEVNAGERALDEIRYHDKNAECWDRMREALPGMDLPKDDFDLRDSLTQREYDHDERQRVRLESKRLMKKRGLQSPDAADALSLTFAMEISDLARRSFEPKDESDGTTTESSVDPD